MNNKIVLESLALDLKRVSLGYQRNSLKMTNHFLDEAIKRKNEVDTRDVKTYLRQILDKVASLQSINQDRIGKDALMYSILIQNYTQKYLV